MRFRSFSVQLLTALSLGSLFRQTLNTLVMNPLKSVVYVAADAVITLLCEAVFTLPAKKLPAPLTVITAAATAAAILFHFITPEKIFLYRIS